MKEGNVIRCNKPEHFIEHAALYGCIWLGVEDYPVWMEADAQEVGALIKDTKDTNGTTQIIHRIKTI